MRNYFFSIIIIPVSTPQNFLDLQYKKLKPNTVSIGNDVSIRVDNSASPLFYKFAEPKTYSEISVDGKVNIESKLSLEEKDTYFQLGVVYEGSYKPGWIVRSILPEWLFKILNINKKYGVGNIDFFHVTGQDYNMDKVENIRAIKMNFKTYGSLDQDNHFAFSAKLKPKKVLGLWLRSDADDHKAKFETLIKSLIIK
jgi:hypothetical protein